MDENESSEAPEVYSIPSNLPFPVVGIGASAGGIVALRSFLQGMPKNSGMCFAVVMHLSPRHDSGIAAVLQKSTSMPVISVTGPTAVEKNHVYVISPRNELTMLDGLLRVQPAKRPRGSAIAIDVFLRSLADAHKERAFAIILSGSGSDGAIGLSRVKEQGGITLAQVPEDSEYPDMPLNAMATGKVDFVLPAADMPDKLMEIWRNARQIALPVDEEIPAIAQPDASPEAEQALRDILDLLRSRSGNDFHHYKRATVLRRIERRLQVNLLKDLPAYRDFLQSEASEAAALLDDMLISVTNFFRDRESFEALERSVMPELFTTQGQEPVRAWVPGCATGEEAYSIAMLLAEQGAESGRPHQYQVFASDIDERAIAIGRAGTYPASVATDIAPTRLRTHFSKNGEKYQISKIVREHVLFARHNVLRDPPFSRIDLISCRNLLIYLDRQVHERIFELFFFALRPGGFLFLGSSESADSGSRFFEIVDKRHRIFRARHSARVTRPMSALPSRFMPLPSPPSVPSLPSHATVRRPEQSSLAEMHQRALEHYSPPSVIVDREYNIVHLSDHVGKYLSHVGGEPSRRILAVVIPELRAELRTTLFQCAHTGKSVEAPRVRLERESRTIFVNMIARPFQDRDGGADYLLVLFEEVEDTLSTEIAVAQLGGRDEVIERLEEDLRRSNERLQTTIEQSETSNEELKASNEELQAINEELRSASEELETSKEELQSLNEELITVNVELKSKVDETAKINDDLQNLIVSADIATLFVDSALRIKRFTPRAVELFNLIPGDIGRCLLDITHRLDYPDLADDSRAAFEDLQLREREVHSIDGRSFQARVLPYRTAENRIDGAVLTFFDTTDLKVHSSQSGAAGGMKSTPVASSPVTVTDNTDLQLKDDFIAVVSHELKNPLNLISVNAEILSRASELRAAAGPRQAVASIRNAVRSQLKIIDDLLDMSRIRTGKLHLVLGPVDINEVVSAIGEIAQADAAASELDVSISSEVEIAIARGDRSRIEQIVWNLVSNAIKFTPPQGKVQVTVGRDEDFITIRVHDTGQGIDAKYLQRIFDMFGQAPGRALHGRSGLGIGLSLVRQIVHHHDGRIRAESEGLGRGSTFTVWLPQYESVGMESPHAPTSGSPPLADVRVLLVEDNADAAQAMQILLSMEGANVVVAESGETGLELLDKRRFDLVLSDIGMSGMDGYTFVKAIRSHPVHGALPVIALTGFTRETDIKKATESGYDAHVSKPVQMDALIPLLRRWAAKGSPANVAQA
jgi:two-component system CheB/CheR fusion protein